MAPYADQHQPGRPRKWSRVRRSILERRDKRGDESDSEDDELQVEKPAAGNNKNLGGVTSAGKLEKTDVQEGSNGARIVDVDDSGAEESDDDVDSDVEDGIDQGASGGKGVSIVSIKEPPASTMKPQALDPPPPKTSGPPPKPIGVSPPAATTEPALAPLPDTPGAATLPGAAQAPARLGNPTVVPSESTSAAVTSEASQATDAASPTSTGGSNLQKGIGPSDSTFPFAFMTSTLVPSGTVAPQADSTSTLGPGNKGGDQGGGKSTEKEGEANPVGNHVLISVGSIGSFILLCFAIWLSVHLLKKYRPKKDGLGSGRASSGSGPRKTGFDLVDRLVAKLPLRDKNNEKGWQSLDDSGNGDFPASRPNPPSYGQDTLYQLRAPSVGPAMSSISGLAANNTQNPNYPASAHKQGPSVSSTDAVQFGTLGPLPSDATYNSSNNNNNNRQEPVQQPSGTYGPAWRQGGNRDSEISSLSSGFGDGEMVVPGAAVKPSPPPAGSTTTPRQSAVLAPPRFSWMSQSRRDTVYTQSSEDSPARFRSVDSWVNQQTGRVRRAQQRERERQDAPPVPTIPGQLGLPGIHNPPVEQSFNMMMGDDEVPRRVQDTYGDMKP